MNQEKGNNLSVLKGRRLACFFRVANFDNKDAGPPKHTKVPLLFIHKDEDRQQY